MLPGPVFQLRIRKLILGAVCCALCAGPSLAAQSEQVFHGRIIECACGDSYAASSQAGEAKAKARCPDPCLMVKANLVLFDQENRASFEFDREDLPKLYVNRNVYVIGILERGARIIEVNNVIPDVPPSLKEAKTVSIVCDACPRAMAKTRAAAFKRLTAWGRYAIVQEPKDAELIFLISANPYLGDYLTRDGPDKRPVQIETVYANVVDPRTGQSLWADRQRVGSWFVASATEDLVDELREIVEADVSPVEREALIAREHIYKIAPNSGK
jgi:hypothetical protein